MLHCILCSVELKQILLDIWNKKAEKKANWSHIEEVAEEGLQTNSYISELGKGELN